MVPTFFKCNFVISIFLLVSPTSSSSIVPNSCQQLTSSVSRHCTAQSFASKSLDRHTYTCCIIIKRYKCLVDNHNATCPPPPGITARLLTSNYNCSQFTDLSKCHTLLDQISPASVTFVTITVLFIICCLCGCVSCRLFCKNDNRDLISSCQLSDFKIPSKSDLKDQSCLSSVKTEDTSCPNELLVTLSDEPIEKVNPTTSLPEPIHPSLLDSPVDTSTSSSSSSNQ